MFNFIKSKITNKKLLNSSLLVGVVLLAGFLCIYPMFREGSLNRLLQTLMLEHIEQEEEYPAAIIRESSADMEQTDGINGVVERMNEYESTWSKYIDCPVVQRQQVLSIKGGNADSTFGSKSKVISIGVIPDLYDHVDLVYGVKAEDAENSDNPYVQDAIKHGAMPCVMSQSVMDKYELVVGETLSFKFKMYSGADMLDMVITGVIEEKQEDNYFWYKRLSSYNDLFILPIDTFDTIVKENDIAEVNYDEVVMFDYTKINNSNAKKYREYLNQFSSLDKDVSNNFGETLKSYDTQEKSISVILFSFELPIVALLLLFLYMISGRILEMETTEIAMLKSRGVSRGKIIRLYISQSSIIAGIGCVIGLPVGFAMCRLAAGTNAFLSFSFKDVSVYKPTVTMLLFALLAFALSVLFMTLPVIRLSKLTITERKNLRVSTKAKPVWEKFFLDILLLAVSGYLLYNFNKQKNVMIVQIISGEGIDPVIFLDSSLFILASGLLFLRLIGYLVRLIYRIGKKRWKPASYVAFLQIIRNAKKQGFITVFLVMTIAMGIFNANLARTVNENMEQRTAYNVGTDVRVQEKWKMTQIKSDSGVLWNYREPDIGRYSFLEEYGVVQKTKVIIDNNTDIAIGTKSEKGNTLMAINTKEFGEIAKLDPNLNDTHWYNYLNELALNPKSVIISSNLAKKYDLSVGDKVSYLRYSPIDSTKTYTNTAATICGIVDAFPGFESTVYVTSSDGSIVEKENYLVVANYATVVNNCNQTPYEIWMRAQGDVDVKAIKKAIESKDITLVSILGSEEEIQNQRNSAMIQITNGMFSVGFIISLLICAVGFLIYWVLTIKEREMLYGIYRAMGMTMREIVNMLVIEQIFSSLLAAASGFGVGAITTFLYTKLISVVYLPRKHNIPIDIFFKADDIIKITIIIGVAFAICFVVMSRTVRNMNITKALKMGED